MFPVQNTAYVTTGLSRFTSRFSQSAAPNLRALAAVYLAGAQELENALFGVIQKKWLANATGVDLDILGDIVGVTRQGLDDTAFRYIIGVQIRVNRSQGLTEDILQVSKLLSPSRTYAEYYPAKFVVTAYSVPYPVYMAAALTSARSVAVGGTLQYATTPRTGHIILGSTVGSTPDATGFQDAVSRTGSYNLVASVST